MTAHSDQYLQSAFWIANYYYYYYYYFGGGGGGGGGWGVGGGGGGGGRGMDLFGSFPPNPSKKTTFVTSLRKHAYSNI